MGNTPLLLYLFGRLWEAGAVLMSSTVSLLRLTRLQVGQLTTHCTTYRSYLWRSLIPTPQRNQTLRAIQALQGRLEKVKEQTQADITLTAEEKSTIKQLLSGMTQLYGAAPPSDQRSQQLAELATLRML